MIQTFVKRNRWLLTTPSVDCHAAHGTASRFAKCWKVSWHRHAWCGLGPAKRKVVLETVVRKKKIFIYLFLMHPTPPEMPAACLCGHSPPHKSINIRKCLEILAQRLDVGKILALCLLFICFQIACFLFQIAVGVAPPICCSKKLTLFLRLTRTEFWHDFNFTQIVFFLID